MPTCSGMESMPISQLVDLWITSRSYAPNSARQRRCILRQFTAAAGDRRPVDLGPADVLGWWAHTEHLAPASRRSAHSAVGGFLRWCRAVGLEAPDIMAEVRRPKVPRRPPKILTAVEEARLRAEVAGTDLALPVALMLDAGLRRSEVCRLRLEDVIDGWMTVHGKGGTVDRLPVPASVAALLPVGPGPVVPMSSGGMARRVHAAMAQVGIHGRTCHALRRTFATRLMLSGVPAVDVMRLLRHSSMGTMTAYVQSSYDAAA